MVVGEGELAALSGGGTSPVRDEVVAGVESAKASGTLSQEDLGSASQVAQAVAALRAVDPTRAALLLLSGDKAGNWDRWYRDNIPLAEQLYHDYTGDTED